jgi:hypothetical protein
LPQNPECGKEDKSKGPLQKESKERVLKSTSRGSTRKPLFITLMYLTQRDWLSKANQSYKKRQKETSFFVACLKTNRIEPFSPSLVLTNREIGEWGNVFSLHI